MGLFHRAANKRLARSAEKTGSASGSPPSGSGVSAVQAKSEAKAPARRRHWLRRTAGAILLLLLIAAVAIRVEAARLVRWYVNRTLDQNPMYEGRIGPVTLSLWRGAYSIDSIRIYKRTGAIAEPFFSAQRLDLALQWDALLHRRLVGRIAMEQPALNFVAARQKSASQTGANGPWLEMIRQLFPFDINRAVIRNGSIHFHAPDRTPPVDVYLSQLNASIENLRNIYNEVKPLFAVVTAQGLAMDQAEFQFQMKFDPFSYFPSFQAGIRLIGLDVTKLNALTRAYGQFDFKRGWFDLVVELNTQEGVLTGYIKPLFRNIQVFSLQDIAKTNPLQFFWEALLGAATQIFKNHPRDQFGTLIPLRGTLKNPQASVVTALGNVLRNAFIRAYLPRFQGTAPDVDWLEFGAGESVTQPLPGGSP